ncbi:MAG: nucleoside/nucleotide kinase family protein [Ilumatobacteraceae bacterium]
MTSLDDRVRAFVAGGGRILGIAGPPGAGKSTLAERIVEAWGPTAQLLPMDGFHLANDELERLGRAARKGAPDTFDVEGYLSALRRVRARETDILVPRFNRDIEEPVAGAIRIAVTAEIVVTEGNYLLLDDGPWRTVRSLLDACWWADVPDDVRVERLVARHVHHGRSPATARAWVDTVDEPNARLVATHRSRPPDVHIPTG